MFNYKYLLAALAIFGLLIHSTSAVFAQTSGSAEDTASLAKKVQELWQAIYQLRTQLQQLSPPAKPVRFIGPPEIEPPTRFIGPPIEEGKSKTSAAGSDSTALTEGVVTPSPADLPEKEPPKEWCHTFGSNLSLGNRGEEVAFLQKVLEKEGFDISVDEKEKQFFGESTAAAVSGFQEKYRSEILEPLGLKYPTGFVGKSTRAKLNDLYGCFVTPPGIPPKVQPLPVNPPTPIIPPKIQLPMPQLPLLPLQPPQSSQLSQPPQPPQPSQPPEFQLVFEEVKCVFNGSDVEQSCKGRLSDVSNDSNQYGSNFSFGCSGIYSCVADVKGKFGSKVRWESSCGGYVYTVLDGKDEYANFSCSSSIKTRQ